MADEKIQIWDMSLTLQESTILYTKDDFQGYIVYNLQLRENLNYSHPNKREKFYLCESGWISTNLTDITKLTSFGWLCNPCTKYPCTIKLFHYQ